MVRVADAVDGDQFVHADAVAIGDHRKAFARAHHVLAGPFAEAGAGAGGLTGSVDQQRLARFHMIGVAEAIELHQLVDAHAMAIGDFREGVAVLHGHMAGGAAATAARA